MIMHGILHCERIKNGKAASHSRYGRSTRARTRGKAGFSARRDIPDPHRTPGKLNEKLERNELYSTKGMGIRDEALDHCQTGSLQPAPFDKNWAGACPPIATEQSAAVPYLHIFCVRQAVFLPLAWPAKRSALVGYPPPR